MGSVLWGTRGLYGYAKILGVGGRYIRFERHGGTFIWLRAVDLTYSHICQGLKGCIGLVNAIGCIKISGRGEAVRACDGVLVKVCWM